jgi:putative membrane protein
MLVPLLFVAFFAFSSGDFGRRIGGTIGRLVAIPIVLMFAVISWWVTRWRIEDGTLRIETGLLRRSSLRFPLTQIQAIDTVRPALARILGLAELRLRMGGSTGSSGRLAYLTLGQAETLRGQLLALAHGIAANTPAPREQVLLSVRTDRLIVSILLSRLGVVTGVLLVGLAVSMVVAPSTAVAAIGGSGTMILGLLTAFWRRFNADYRLTVADAPDGLHLRSGLVDTAAETIPRGRVQAIRMIEPLLWRSFGWCRVEVDVAGRQRAGRENRSQSRELRAVLPVGTHEEAVWLLGRLLPDAPADRIPAPPRARYKAPLRYHYLAWGRTDTCAVASSGRVARITSWVPLTKVQSLRLVQGPLQRRLRLATIHLDTAGRRVGASLLDRDVDEADRVLAELTELSRAARKAGRGRSSGRPPDGGSS